MKMIFLLRPDDAHKGMMGHSLLISGKYGMAGASILSTKACLRSGVGKVTVHIPKRNNDILQTTVPEAIVSHDSDDFIISDISVLKDDVIKGNYQSVAVGPGIGTDERTALMLKTLLSDMQNGVRTPLVLDADALNILSQHVDMFQLLPKNTILTPHLMELGRMVSSYFDYVGEIDDITASLLAKEIECYVIMKGHRTAICCPDGSILHNETGNSGMATAGSGDVLTGMLAGLLARGYAPDEACVLGTYLHGLAGDIAVKEMGKESLVASDIVRYLPKAFLDSGCH